MAKKKRKDDFVNNQQENFNFKYDGVLHNASQEGIYMQVRSKVVLPHSPFSCAPSSICGTVPQFAARFPGSLRYLSPTYGTVPSAYCLLSPCIAISVASVFMLISNEFPSSASSRRLHCTLHHHFDFVKIVACGINFVQSSKAHGC